MKPGSTTVFFPLLLLAASLSVAPAAQDETPPYAPTDAYEDRQIEGWRVRVNKAFLRDEPELAARTLALMQHQLFQIPRLVPAGAVAKLRKVTIWVELDEPHHKCMAYHPEAGWLRDNGMNPDKADCVEVADARAFLDWTRRQPWMVLHELAHAYHDQFLEGGFGNPDVAAAHARARDGKRYDAVLRADGRRERAYAMNNPMEFFAECSEAYFGTNDFYPFVRPELKEHDPQTHELLAKLWGDGAAAGR